MFMYYYTVRYFTCIFYAVVRQISMLFIDNKYSVLGCFTHVMCIYRFITVLILITITISITVLTIT